MDADAVDRWLAGATIPWDLVRDVWPLYAWAPTPGDLRLGCPWRRWDGHGSYGGTPVDGPYGARALSVTSGLHGPWESWVDAAHATPSLGGRVAHALRTDTLPTPWELRMATHPPDPVTPCPRRVSLRVDGRRMPWVLRVEPDPTWAAWWARVWARHPYRGDPRGPAYDDYPTLATATARGDASWVCTPDGWCRVTVTAGYARDLGWV